MSFFTTPCIPILRVLGVDDVESECGLDDYSSWNLKISNNNEADFKESMMKLNSVIQDSL